MARPPDPTLFDSLPGLPVPADFDSFWQRYPHKEGKASARRHWAKLSAADRADACDALTLWCEFWRLARTEQCFIPHGSTWVYQRRWEDDIPALPTTTFTRARGAAGLDELARLAHAQTRAIGS
jgi:hypothetical protein